MWRHLANRIVFGVALPAHPSPLAASAATVDRPRRRQFSPTYRVEFPWSGVEVVD